LRGEEKRPESERRIRAAEIRCRQHGFLLLEEGDLGVLGRRMESVFSIGREGI